MEIKSSVIRCAVKSKKERVQKGGNKLPMRKNASNEIRITTDACISLDNELDYNHYRIVSKSLKGTRDRAVSIVTDDIYNKLREFASDVQIGDLGENLTISIFEYTELKPGIRLKIGEVILEITEICVPCARLGLVEWCDSVGGSSWWNKKSNTKISRFINLPGARGWYAKVIKEGIIHNNDQVEFYIKK